MASSADSIRGRPEAFERTGGDRAVRVLTVLGAVLLLMTALTVHVRDAVLDSDEFSDRVLEATATPEARAAIAGQVVDEIVAYDADLLLYRPLIRSIVDVLVETTVFDEILRFGIADLHRTVFDDADDTLTVRLSDLVLLVKVSLAKVDADATALIPDELVDAIVVIRADTELVDAAQFAGRVRAAALVLPVLTLASFAAALWLAGDRRSATVNVGIATAVTGVVLAIGEVLVRAVVVRGAADASSRAVTASLWDALLGDLVSVALALVVIGGIVAGTAALGPRRFGDLSIRRMAEVVLRPAATRFRGVSRSIVVGVIGVLFIIEWEFVARLGLAVVGASLVVVAFGELRHALARPAGRRSLGARAEQWWPLLARVLGGGAVLFALGAILVLISRSDGDQKLEAAGGPECNGSVLLCDRRVDEVAFATTHNAMAAANDDFAMGFQTVGIVAQLEDGYRGFLIDAYFGLDADGRVVTDRAPLDDDERAQMIADFGEAVVTSAEALHESLGGTGDNRDVYLCHSFCEIGAVKMSDELTRVREWLELHPREVLLVVIQDEGPRGSDIERAFRRAGMLDMVHTQEIDAPWPTLGEMIRSGRRVWVAAENRPGDQAWYHDAFTFVQDTPYSPTTLDDFSCEPFRGEPDSPLFLINHWLSPASPTNADIANSRRVLEERLADCDEVRGLFPNMIAVDFSDRGDTIAVVDELNGVDRDR